MNEREALKLFHKAVEEAGSQRALAVKLGVSAPYVNDIYHGRRGMGPAILKALGLKAVVTVDYKQK